MHEARRMFLTGDGTEYSRKRDLYLQNPYQITESGKYEIFYVPQVLIWRQKRVTRVRQLASDSSSICIAISKKIVVLL